MWTLPLKESEEVIGDCELIVQEADGVTQTELGSHARRDWWGRGLATEAAQACRDYGFDQLGKQRMIWLIHPDTIASRRVAEKTGMTLMKLIQHRARTRCLYAIEGNQS